MWNSLLTHLGNYTTKWDSNLITCQMEDSARFRKVGLIPGFYAFAATAAATLLHKALSLKYSGLSALAEGKKIRCRH